MNIKDLQGADLRNANLRGANLQGADLRDTNLLGANLIVADLRDANLRGANLRDANLRGANLRGANLRDTDLQNADLQRASLQNTDLRGANLRGANLRGANLRGANLPHFQICPEEGEFTAYKKTSEGAIKILIPATAKRTSSLIGRKCRAEFIVTLETPNNLPCCSIYNNNTTYNPGNITTADKYDNDIRMECTHGIHFFMTRKEADEYNC